MTTAIQRFVSNDNIEVYIDTTTGESFCSIRGYARLSGKAYSTINQRVQGVRFSEVKTLEADTGHGVQGVRLLPEALVVQMLTEDAPAMLAKFAMIGVRMFLHQLAGYSVVSTAVVKPEEKLTRREMAQRWLEAEIALEAAQQEIDTLVTEVSDLTPRAIAWDSIADTEGLMKLNDVAGALGMGRTTFTRKLVDLGLMYPEHQGNGKVRNRAYAKYINKGYLYEKLTDVKNTRGDLVYSEFTTLVTKKGAEWIATKV